MVRRAGSKSGVEVSFYQLVAGGLRDAGWQGEHRSQNRLAILRGRTHYDTFLVLVRTVVPFLDGEDQAATWAGQVGGND